jgi:hypothetical protein
MASAPKSNGTRIEEALGEMVENTVKKVAENKQLQSQLLGMDLSQNGQKCERMKVCFVGLDPGFQTWDLPIRRPAIRTSVEEGRRRRKKKKKTWHGKEKTDMQEIGGC